MAELKASYRKYNDEEERIFRSDPANEDKPYQFKKLDEAIICSGERDSLCVRSLGYFPLWFNSETYKVSPEEIREIYKYVERIYNLPDIDPTGIRKGRSLLYASLTSTPSGCRNGLAITRTGGASHAKTSAILPSYARKKDFQNLMTLATPAKF